MNATPDIHPIAAMGSAQFNAMLAHLPDDELPDEDVEFRTFRGGNVLIRRPADGALFAMQSEGAGALRYLPGDPGTMTLFAEGVEVLTTESATPEEWNTLYTGDDRENRT